MGKDLFYEVTENGYHIHDRNDGLFHIHQYEPYIPDPSKSYEENAIAHIEALTADPTYTLDEAAAIIASEVAKDE